MKNIENTPQTTFLKDYTPSPYKIRSIDLEFELEKTATLVTSRLSLENDLNDVNSLQLQGEELELVSISNNGTEVSYELNEEGLLLKDLPKTCNLEIKTKINPENNKTLSGLYRSGGIFCTQCEAEGFRRITYYLDRPDIMAKFSTKIIADKAENPILLSNGNLVESGELPDNKHFALWEDPYPKPSYLFALVAGDLGVVKDSFMTKSGRNVRLEIYCDKGNEYKCDHAMTSLKKSMKWDEETYGLEYDLDIYMIVAVDSFNMGAMENKGLNIFNSQYVLASEQTATDTDFINIESIIGHEYFHNWSGNRVTCRDWFQLTLKEGLTVYRDQEFSSDLNSRTVQRIEDVSRLRTVQFPEDNGPMSHPIRPASYIQIDNFYTSTVYEKGAEIIRMVELLLGKEGFRKGIDKYFELFDGQAVTTEDFIHAMSIANNNFDFSQFVNWYHQSGTPKVKANWNYNKDREQFSLTLEQIKKDSGQKDFYIPMKIGLINKLNGKDLTLADKINNKEDLIGEDILVLDQAKKEFVFEGIKEEVLPSLNRGFRAPVMMESSYSDREIAFLMENDSDFFNRYEAIQLYARNLLANNNEFSEELFLESFGKVIADDSIEPALKAFCIKLPPEEILHQDQEKINYQETFDLRWSLNKKIAERHKDALMSLVEKYKNQSEYKIDFKAIGERSIVNNALGILMYGQFEDVENLVWERFNNATNMTDELSAFGTLRIHQSKYGEEASQKFYHKWKSEPLVINKWFAIEASIPNVNLFEGIKVLTENPLYDQTVPNKFRSVWGSFAHNYSVFNHRSGDGYKIFADQLIELDKINPQIAARMGNLFRDYSSLYDKEKSLMKDQLDRILGIKDLSKNTYEIISKIASSN